MRVRDYFELYVLATAGLFAAFMLGWIACDDQWRDQQPDCPLEDSCHVDYYDGAWHITEDQ